MRKIVPHILIIVAATAGCTDSPVTERENSSPDTGGEAVQSSASGTDLPEESSRTPLPAASNDPPERERPNSPEEDNEAMRTIDELLLFFPTKYPDGDWEPDELDFQDVWFEAEDGTKLHGWYVPHQDPRAILLFAHGNAGNLSHRAWLARLLQEQLQVSVMMFDYRGYGRSGGTPSAKGILQDGRAAGAKLAELAGVKESDLVLMGRSLGGAVMVPLAVEIEARGLILQNTFSSLKDVAAFHYSKLSWVVPEDKLNSAAVISDYQGPLLQSHGDADQIVPYESGRKLFEAANEPKQWVTIPGGNHNDAQTEEFYETLEIFLQTLPNE